MASNAKASFEESMTISPSEPKKSWTTPELAKNVTATLHLTVDETGTYKEIDYQ